MNDELLKYITVNYPNEHDLIGRSLTNYYSLRLLSNKTDKEELQQDMFMEGVLELLELLSSTIAKEISGDSNDILESFKEIYIQT
jgi:hypothetical protein